VRVCRRKATFVDDDVLAPADDFTAFSFIKHDRINRMYKKLQR
jgi:hypothetical protein